MRHQLRHYVRIRDIEVNRYRRAVSDQDKQKSSPPRIDRSWQTAMHTLAGQGADSLRPVKPRVKNGRYVRAAFLPNVALPHAITLAIGLGLFGMGPAGALPDFTLGNPPAAAAK